MSTRGSESMTQRDRKASFVYAEPLSDPGILDAHDFSPLHDAVSRLAKRILLQAGKAVGLFRLARWWTRDAVCVLAYHGTWRMEDGSPGDALFIRPETFAARLDVLQRNGYAIAPLHAAIDALSSGATPSSRTVVITIDDGWYGTYADMLPALETRRLPATLYCDTAHLAFGEPIPHVLARYLRDRHDAPESPEAREAYRAAIDRTRSLEERHRALESYVELTGIDSGPYLRSQGFRYMTPEQLRDLHRRGIEVELHTHHHTLHDFSPSRVREEIQLNRAALASILGDESARTHFCYPSGETDPGIGDLLRELGVVTATTTEHGLVRQKSDRYGLPRYLDGDHVSPIEFEAWVSGFTDMLRDWWAAFRGLLPRRVARPAHYPTSEIPSGRNRGFASPPASS